MNGAGYLGAGAFEYDRGENLNGGGQRGQNSPNDPFSNSHPCAERYDPSVASIDQQALYGYNPALNFGAGNQTNHQLLMSMSGGGLGGSSSVSQLAALNQLRFSQHMLNSNNFKGNHIVSNGVGASNLPLQNSGPSYSGYQYPSASSNMSQIHSQHDGGDIDPLLFMSGLLGYNRTPPPPTTTPPATAGPLIQSSSGDDGDQWLTELQITCKSLSLEPLSGSEVLQRIRKCMDDVLSKYIPCVDFLVECQQSLRKGLAIATQKHRVHGKRYYQEAMNPAQFFASYIEPLPHQFYAKTETIMDANKVYDAISELQKLVDDARKSARQGCEAVKNSFLGGMKDGESWGLRKWLSRHGNALSVCTDLECLLGACKQLDRKLESTKKLARILRSLAKGTLDRLKGEIPASYQERSAAHPYLPFFHRLEAALRGMSQFDPEEDVVICLDDSDDDEEDIEVVKAPLPPKRSRKRKQPPQDPVEDPWQTGIEQVKPPPSTCKPDAYQALAESQANTSTADSVNYESSSGESEAESVVEIVDFKPPSYDHGTTSFPAGAEAWKERSEESAGVVWPLPVDKNLVRTLAQTMAGNLTFLASSMVEESDEFDLPANFPRESFWDEHRYSQALHIFVQILRSLDAIYFVNPIDEELLISAGMKPFSHVIKNPLSFRDITSSLIEDSNYDGYPSQMKTGRLPLRSLSNWNMWKGNDLLQAIDLVLLNSLAYGKAIGDGRSKFRSAMNKMRKFLWDGINGIVAEADPAVRRRCTPTRRSESSGFIVHKISER